MGNTYHDDQEKWKISAVLGSKEFERFRKNSVESPLFVFPLDKKQAEQDGLGFLSVLSQANMPRVSFTPLSDYKSLGSASQPILTITHYTELQDSKGVVLARGDFARSATGESLSFFEGKKLMALIYFYYINP